MQDIRAIFIQEGSMEILGMDTVCTNNSRNGTQKNGS